MRRWARKWQAGACLAGAVWFGAPAALAADYVVEVNKPGRAFPGTTVFMETKDLARPRIVELDLSGRVVWDYPVPPDLVQGSYPGRGADVEWLAEKDRFLFVLPFKGVYEVDRNRQIVWSHLTPRISHDADRLQNGHTVYTWGWDLSDQAQVTEVDPSGRVVWEWFAGRHLDPGQRKYDRSAEEEGFCHTNAVERLKNGHTLISLRNFNRIVEVDPSGQIAWTRGRLPGVHQPTELKDGHILLAIRRDDQAMEIDRSGQVVWRFKQDDVRTIRALHRLPNGNTLIGERTKILEVTPQGETVWQVRKEGVAWDLDLRAASRRRDSGQRPTAPQERWFFTAQRLPAPGR